MKRSTIILALVAMVSLVASAQMQNVEFGLQVGIGSFKGLETPNTTPTCSRTHEFAPLAGSYGMPAFETFGLVARYRIDQRWAVQLQGMRQRMRFQEDWTAITGTKDNYFYFYNAMWNIDAMAEFNFLNYGFVANRVLRVHTVTPYVALGIGTSLYNKTATYRFRNYKKNDGNYTYLNGGNTSYPALKLKDLAAALYMPIAAGVKFRVAQNVQMKLAVQYDLYLLNGNVDGSTKTSKVLDDNGNEVNMYNLYHPGKNLGISYEGVKYNAASTHNVVLTLGVIYNLPAQTGGVFVE